MYKDKQLANKASLGNYFEDLTVGLKINHAVSRTVTEGDAALYLALTASRYPLFCNTEFAKQLGFVREPIHDLLVFHIEIQFHAYADDPNEQKVPYVESH